MAFVKNYLRNYQNYKENWNYEDGCVLIGAHQLYQATGDECYRDFIFKYLNDFISADGTIKNYRNDEYNIDNINAGKVLFFAYAQTGDEKYRLAIENLMNQLRSHPRTKSGSFYHKMLYPNQIWLDGLYMAQPFYMEYETKFNKMNQYQDILNQFRNVKKYLFDQTSGLYFHAYDETKTIFWADKVTGCSKNFWLRSIGWYMMALVDTMAAMSREIYEQYDEYRSLLKEIVDNILRYQDPGSHLFYQVVDQGKTDGNYLETSGTAMIAYAVLKACNLQILSKEKYLDRGKEIFDSLTTQKLVEENGQTILKDICLVAGLGPEDNLKRDGSVEYYLSEPRVANDSKGVGPYMMALAQRIMAGDEEKYKEVL